MPRETLAPSDAEPLSYANVQEARLCPNCGDVLIARRIPTDANDAIIPERIVWEHETPAIAQACQDL